MFLKKRKILEFVVVLAFILLGVGLRLLPHPPNFAPVAAIALFAGVYLSKKTAFILPVVVMVLSDIFFGHYELVVMTSVYGSFLLIGVTPQVKKREHRPKEKRIYINDKQYFEGITPEDWNYHIGGYQVLDKWLKDRIGKKLSPEDINHYLKVITAIKHTIDLQEQIDKIYPEVEKNLLGFEK